MTINANDVRARLVLASSEAEWAAEKLETEARLLDGHDTPTAVFLREQAAALRASAGQVRQQARRLADTPGSVCG